MITDFCTGRQIETQALLRMARYAEEAEEFDMSTLVYETPCGSAGCLLGTFAIREFTALSGMSQLDRAAWECGNRLGLSDREKQFLFYGEHLTGARSIRKVTHATDAEELSKARAIRRLRKFIYYKLRKSELLADYEAARRMGDVGFVGKVLEAVS